MKPIRSISKRILNKIIPEICTFTSFGFMTSIRVRPRFKLATSYAPEDLTVLIKQQIQNTKSSCYAESLLKSFVVLKIKKEEQHFWSPQLTLSIDRREGGSFIRGLYTPKPTIWSMFIFLYTGIGVCILFAGLYGLSRLSLNLEAPILWSVPALFGLALLLYLIAQFGQKLGARQMFDLHHFLEEAIDKKVRIY